MKRLLVDTHAVLWWLADDPALPDSARELVGDPECELLVSVASLWEIAIKLGSGKLRAPADLPETIREEGFMLMPVEPEDAWAVRDLPEHHRDPFDRMLIAQAINHGLPILTADPRFGEYPVDVRW